MKDVNQTIGEIIPEFKDMANRIKRGMVNTPETEDAVNKVNILKQQVANKKINKEQLVKKLKQISDETGIPVNILEEL